MAPSARSEELSALIRMQVGRGRSDRISLFDVRHGGEISAFRNNKIQGFFGRGTLDGLDDHAPRRFDFVLGRSVDARGYSGGYSALMASIGSTLAARAAGQRLAPTETARITTGVMTKVSGSSGPTPYSMARIRRVANNAPINPIANPGTTARMASPRMSARTPAPLAPRAMRTPSSRCRCATVYARTP